ncbi:MAG: glycosyltransferase [Ignavibacteriales bacterium]|nr:glycosyltransferase [Ignavibacteriales bacterium]
MGKRVLVAPLDWGLGHATRCIPIIRELLSHHAEVILAADGRPYELLRREFPDLHLLRLPGISIHYGNASTMMLTMGRQIPSILRSIAREHAALQPIIREQSIDAVISDNRFGLYSDLVPTVYMTHQLRILIPAPFRIFQSLLQALNTFAIQRFTHCWVPDFPGDVNLSGILSHVSHAPGNVKFIGPLSRFRAVAGTDEKIDCLAILSGPEPQRTIFEDLLLEGLKKLSLQSVVVRGTPERKQNMKLAGNVRVISSLPSEELNRLAASASVVIARPGYSTIMDLAVLGKKALMIPTPGQTEQEYLASQLASRGICAIQKQDEVNLKSGIEIALRSRGFEPTSGSCPPLEETINLFLATL